MARWPIMLEALISDKFDPTRDLVRFRERLLRGTAGRHLYAGLLGLDTLEAAPLLRAVDRGIPYRAFERFRRNSSLSVEQLIDLLNIPRRTLTRRKVEGRFLRDESDRLLRVARLFGKTLELFEGDRDAAIEWLTRPKLALGGSVPLDLARTELGSQEVERLVGQLEHGVFP